MNRILSGLVVLALAAPASATIYNDNTGDTFFGGILDIVSLEVTNDLTDISFKFTLAGDVDAADWGKYCLIFDTVPGGDPAGDGWGRPISMPQGADYWIGSWVDGGNGAELYNYGGSWSLTQATYNPPPNDITITKGGTVVTITTQLAALGLVPNDVIYLDAFTTGGGGSDSAVDSLGNPNQTFSPGPGGEWSSPVEAVPVEYTVTPEPATMGLMALGVAAMLRRRK